MITGIVGLPGEGKSLWASMQIKEHLDNDERTVYSSLHVNDERPWIYFRLADFKLLVHLRQAVIFLDEAQIAMNSRNWKDFPPEFQYYLQQHRHQGVDIYAMTQNLNRTDIVFRELVQDLYQVNKSFVWDPLNLFVISRFTLTRLEEPPTGYVETEDVTSFWAFRTQFEYYNTHAREIAPMRPILGACDECGREHMLLGWEAEATADAVA